MKNFIAFDLETTGLSRDDEIIEIGLVKVCNGKISDKFSTLIKPTKRIPKDIIELTGIDQNMVENSPVISEVIDNIIEFIGKDIIVGHNVGFDIDFISRFIKIENEFVDTLKLVRIFYPFSYTHSLGHLAKYLGINVEKEHRALDDAITTAKIILKMNEDIRKIEFKILFQIIDILPESAERNYIKDLIKDESLEKKYDYEIPTEHYFVDKEDNEIILKDERQIELFKDLLKNKFSIFEFPILQELKEIAILPVIKYVKENKEKFCVVKLESDNTNEFFEIIKNLTNEHHFGIKVVFINNKESYLCLKKFNETKKSSRINLDPYTAASLIFWLSKTKTGNLNEIKNIVKEDDIKINVDVTCDAENCEYFKSCFFFDIKNKEKESDIVITNYLNFFRNNLEYKNFIFLDTDEFEEKSTQGFAITISFKEIDYIIKRSLETMENLESLNDDYKILKENFMMLGKEVIANNENFRNGILFSEYKDRFISLSEIITDIKNRLVNTKYIDYLNIFLERLNNLFKMENDFILKINFINTEDPLSAYYVFYPVEIWNRIKEKFMETERIIFISKALTTSCNFDFFKIITGLDKIKEDIKTHSYNLKKDDMKKFRIYFATYLPSHNSNKFNRDVLSMLEEVFKGFKKSYVMFTSYTNAEKVYDLIEDKDKGIFVKHAKYKNLKNVLKSNEEYIVLGTTHLFDKVKEKRFDILVIPKIPFPNMADKIIKRRNEALSKFGVDPFNNYLLPTTIIKIKKSILKIMKLSFDKCAIIILDRRIFEKDYSNIIIDSLPVESEKVESNEELKGKLKNFFNG